VHRFNTSVLKLTGAPSLGDACEENIDCTVYFGSHAECIIGRSGGGECGCRNGAHFKDGRCYETACKYSTETLGLTSLQTLQSVSYKELISLTSQLEVSQQFQNNGKDYEFCIFLICTVVVLHCFVVCVCACGCMSGFCNVCVCEGFVMCG
jgi:hypothetical protein